jgi:hypothetical protein
MKKLFISILCTPLFILLFSGCCVLSRPSLPEAPCAIETLLVPDNVLPEDVFYETGTRSAYDPPSRIGIEKIGTLFASDDSGGLIHHIYRFRAEEEAREELESVITYEFKNKNEVQWFSPPIAPQINADKYKLACMELSRKGFRCRLVTQYKVYFSDLIVDLITLDYDDLKSIIEDLDNRMVSCVKPQPTTLSTGLRATP